MPDTTELHRVSPLLNADKPLIDCEGLHLQARLNTTSIQVLAFKNQQAAVARDLSSALGLECPTNPGRCYANQHRQIAWHGPNQWMIIDDSESRTLLETVKAAVGGKAAVVDQSHGRVGLRLRGRYAGDVMQKNCALDLHPRHFKVGHCALGIVAHINALLIQVDDTPTYDLFVNRSFARSFADVLTHACGEFAYRSS